MSVGSIYGTSSCQFFAIISLTRTNCVSSVLMSTGIIVNFQNSLNTRVTSKWSVNCCISTIEASESVTNTLQELPMDLSSVSVLKCSVLCYKPICLGA